MPGNGKGVMGATMIVEELRLGKRPIITNFATEKMPWVTRDHEPRIGLRAYLQKTYDDDFDCLERIFRVSDEAMQNFYLYRALTRRQVEKLGAAHLVGYRQVTPLDGVMTDEEFRLHKDCQLYVCDHEIKVDKQGRGHCEKFNAVLLEHSGPHLNLADECWKFWPARGWQSTSEADVYYNAQHRHFGDDNVYMTQRHNDIDSIIVDRCQECIVMVNHGKLTFGLFRQPAVFRVSVYNGRPMPSKEPMSTRILRPDVKGLLQTYDTSAGIGISGRGAADTNERKKKGLPFWSMPLIVLAVLFAIGYGIKGGASYAVGLANGRRTLKTGMANKPADKVARPRPKENVETKLVDSGEKSPPDQTDEPARYCTGYCLNADSVTVFFSDGTTAGLEDGVQRVEKNAVWIAGRRWPVHSAKNAVQVAADSVRPVGSPSYYSSGINAVPAYQVPASRPVNEAIILPGIYGQGGDGPPPSLHGLANMERVGRGAQAPAGYGQGTYPQAVP